MIDYRAGTWGLHVALGWKGSLAPRALCMAFPNAAMTFLVATFLFPTADMSEDDKDMRAATSKQAQYTIGAYTAMMVFILYNRSRTSYGRWWEGGTLLQKTRGEWFNAFSSILAFTSTKRELEDQVDKYVHLLARLMSLLMCCGLQQVSPHRDRPFEIIDLDGIEPESMDFLNSAPDKVEIILQWIQRSMVLHVHTGVLPVAPPILSRAFQEVSRGIVNLQNARKIADFPYPFPLAQLCMILQLVHYAGMPIGASLAMPRAAACAFAFTSIFVLWCIHFNALDLEFPFGSRVNDLPMNEMQAEWNKSLVTLLDKRATRPPAFNYDPAIHNELVIVMSDASELYVPVAQVLQKGVAKITLKSEDDKEQEKLGERPKRKSLAAGGNGQHTARIPGTAVPDNGHLPPATTPIPITPMPAAGAPDASLSAPAPKADMPSAIAPTISLAGGSGAPPVTSAPALEPSQVPVPVDSAAPSLQQTAVVPPQHSSTSSGSVANSQGLANHQSTNHQQTSGFLVDNQPPAIGSATSLTSGGLSHPPTEKPLINTTDRSMTEDSITI